jgi:alpha-glucoside transport system permease protein
MPNSKGKKPLSEGVLGWLTTTLGRILISLIVPIVTFLVLWQVFMFLRDSNAPQLVIVVVAIIWGVGGIAILFVMGWYLAVPVVRTLILSFKNDISTQWVGLDNYIFAFTDRIMMETFRNNLLWMIVGTSFSVGIGLLVAVLADRSRFESIYKSIIFMPMAISFVGAGVIWKFIYTYKGEGIGINEIGLLNAIVIALGGTPQPWLSLPPWNTFFLIAIMVWLQTGYAMVILSSAIKGIPAELLEAARIDGASEIQAFFLISIPIIKGTLITVTTTIVIFSLKLFDIVRVMTGGNNGTNVIANEFYLQRFTYGNTGRASAIAIVLLVAVIPVIVNNLREFNRDRRAF